MDFALRRIHSLADIYFMPTDISALETGHVTRKDQ